MRTTQASKVISLALVAGLLTFASGCGLLTVDMTSSPATVKSGDPVTFNIKLTNQSQCPLETSLAILIPFISQAEINAEFSTIPPGAPPEVLAFLEELRDFLDQLCSGGHPAIPTPPFATQNRALTAGLQEHHDLTMNCNRTESAIVCEISGRVNDSGNGMTFMLFGDRLACEVDDFTIHCDFRIPLSPLSTPLGVASAAVQPLNCLTADQLAALFGGTVDTEFGAICFVGSLPMISGLGPNEMATGSVTLPAHGSGVTRNLVIAISDDPEDVGVCKGGSDAGNACDRDDFMPCAGGTCGEGICVVGGANDGLGCDVATQGADCPGGTCQVCNVALPAGALPIDCTTTYVSPEPTPVLAPWGLVTMAAILLATGTMWLQRRRRRE